MKSSKYLRLSLLRIGFKSYLKKKPWIRVVHSKYVFLFNFLTTLREWYYKKALWEIIGDRSVSAFLDAGCGNGRFSYIVGKRYRDVKVTGVDIDREGMKTLQDFVRYLDLKNIDFQYGYLVKLNYQDQFDLAFCGSVLEHIVEDEKVLENLFKALKRRGSLLVYVPLSPKRILRFFARKEKAEGKIAGQHYGHVREYSAEEIVEKIEKSGFRIERTIFTYGWFGELGYEIFQSLRDCRFSWFFSPLYFLLVHPFVLIMMGVDYLRENKSGNGIMIL